VEAVNWGSKVAMCTPRAVVEDRVCNNPDCNLVVQVSISLIPKP